MKKILPLLTFSIAMGYLEAAVVVYLRKIYYPGGFDFPLVPMEPALALTEVFREVATIIMLVWIALIAGRNTLQKFSFFIFCFGVWDIFYYVFLKIILDWPESFLTPDILFLIPFPWVGPVLAPCLVSAIMIIFALLILHLQEKGYPVKIKNREALFLISGCLSIIFSFMLDYMQHTISGNSEHGMWTMVSHESMFIELRNYVPTNYTWSIFILGQALILIGIVVFWKRTKKYTIKL